jgi:hypothetical protein
MRVRTILISAGLLLVAAGVLQSQLNVAAPPGNVIMREPVVNVDVSGGTLTGPVHDRYTVYNGGFVSYSEASGLIGSSSAGTTGVSEAVVDQLIKDLEDAGAFKLTDQRSTVSDVPLTTVTVLKGDTNARAHTFSYWLAIDDYAAVGQVLDDFRRTYIPSSF